MRNKQIVITVVIAGTVKRPEEIAIKKKGKEMILGMAD